MSGLQQDLYGNPVYLWIIALAAGVATYVALKLSQRQLAKHLPTLTKRTKTRVDDLIVDLISGTRGFLLFALALYVASLVLSLPPTAEKVITTIAIVSVLLQAAFWGNRLIGFYIADYTRKQAEVDASTATTISALGFLGRLALWVVVVLLALDNMGINITALIAGLGVGGIAVALAVQNILGDLFASLSIVLDKPFVIGDFIIVDNYMGTVEHIGLKTTRIRSLFGEQLVFSNNDLLQSRIRNFKRMYERRVVFMIGVTYQTPYEKLKRIPGIIREIIESQELVRFDRAHFKEYGNFSLNYEVVYWVLNPDYNVYMDIHQNINLELYRRFQEEGIEFAYPTQTVFVEMNQSPKEEMVSTATGEVS